MIVTLDLSSSRKQIVNAIEELRYQAKMNDLPVQQIKKVLILSISYVLINSKEVSAKDLDFTEHVEIIYSYLQNIFLELGYPTVDLIAEILRRKNNILDYMKLKFK